LVPAAGRTDGLIERLTHLAELTVAYCDFSNALKSLDETWFAISRKVHSNMVDVGVTKIYVLVTEFLYVTSHVL